MANKVAKYVANIMDVKEDKALMEPMKISSGSADYMELIDLAMDLARKI